MWTWADESHTAAILVTEEGSIFCGINVEPLMSWLAEGNTPEEINNGM